MADKYTEWNFSLPLTPAGKAQVASEELAHRVCFPLYAANQAKLKHHGVLAASGTNGLLFISW